jgi:tetratricopeptide (TPR) repeat protein
MAELWLQVVPLRAADGPPLVHAMHEKMVRAEISGLEKRLEIDPVNAPLHDDAAVLYAEIGRLDRAAAHFAETARLTPDSAAAHYNLGNALFQQGRRVEAAAQLREAVALRPGYALAHDGLGVALYAEGRTNEAIGEFERASELDPRSADAHDHLAIALRHAGRLADAIAHYRQALAIEPTRASAKAELADVERQLATSGALVTRVGFRVLPHGSFGRRRSTQSPSCLSEAALACSPERAKWARSLSEILKSHFDSEEGVRNRDRKVPAAGAYSPASSSMMADPTARTEFTRFL